MPSAMPVKLNLKKDEKLEIHWADGEVCTYSLDLLRSQCPCALCRELRQEQQQRRSLLTVLPGNYARPLSIRAAQLVGNYAIRFDWSDDHDSGIYTFDYLREICPPK